MDIIDVMLARAMTPQGQTETYVSIANAAAAKAEKAESDAQAAIDVVTGAAEEIASAQEAAADLLASAQEALETAQEAQINTLDTEDVDDEISKLDVSVNLVNGTNVNKYQVITTYPDNTLHTEDATKMYKATGTNEDGTMTQKAITNALAAKADKSYVDSAIAGIPAGGGSGSGTVHFSTDDAGHIVIIDEDGNAVAGLLTEDDIIDSMMASGTYKMRAAVGLEMDYANKTFSRLHNATNLSSGADFDQYVMYGGRVRCNVADDGTINAFYGDNSYRDDGSNGQVMIYQPKFYYQRTPMVTANVTNGTIIRHETLVLSAIKERGFKVAPIFKSDDDELDYVLLSAYEGSLVNNKLASVAGNKPLTDITVAEAETKANLRGEGWHITSIAAEATNQMLEVVEFGSMNGQTSLEAGICNIEGITGVNCSSLTGSTTSLGNASGHASSTTNEINGNTTTETIAGKRAISYRGLENPWGNVWHMLGDINIKGDGKSQGGTPYICTDFNYTPGTIGSNYESIGVNLPSVYGWISAMAQPSEKYDWVFLPGECASVANSLLPIGDNLWVVANVSENKILALGGSYNLSDDVGPFYYAADRNLQESARNNYGARLMFIPTKDNIYAANINKWKAYMGE